MSNKDKKRLNLFMNESIYQEVKNYAEINGISVAGSISVLCKYAISIMKTIDLAGQVLPVQQKDVLTKEMFNPDNKDADADPDGE